MSRTDEKIEELRLKFLQRAADGFDMAMENGDATYAESPIERLFVAACLAEHWRVGCGAELYWMHDRLDEAGIDLDEHRYYQGGILISEWNSQVALASQVPLILGDRSVRIDFALILFTGDKFAIEFDGHDFHDRTKEQAQRDKSRDRLLTAKGWSPVRFTGSEVWKDPSDIVAQVRRLMMGPIERFRAKEAEART